MASQASTPAGAQLAAPITGPSRTADVSAACAGDPAADDGSAETGYGWVPSAVEGIYVREVDAADHPSRYLLEVCVCWLRTRADNEIDFEVVFYTRDGDGPALEPYASVPSTATGVPEGVTGRFYPVDTSGVILPPGTSYVGVRWNPSADVFFFVCTDTSRGTRRVETFFIDDRASAWSSVFESRDPIFLVHRAIMVRVRSRPVVLTDVPMLPAAGLVILAVLVAVVGLRLVNYRSRGSAAE